MASKTLPIIDISAALGDDPTSKREIARAIDRACVETGFFAVTGHGVPAELIEALRAAAFDFFALPEDEKLRVERPPTRISRGYNALGDRALAYSRGIETPPDFQESLAIGPVDTPDEPYYTCERAGPFFRAQSVARAPCRSAPRDGGVFRPDGTAGDDVDAPVRLGAGPGRARVR